MTQQKFVRLLIQSQDGLLMIHEIKKNGYDGWNFPGGKIEPHEDPAQAAARELKEELNLTAEKLTLLTEMDVFFGQKTSQWHGYFYLCRVQDWESLKIKEPDMCLEYRFVPLNELDSLDKCAVPVEFRNFLKTNCLRA